MRGFSADMSEAVIIMTTNCGAELFSTGRVGFGETSSEVKSAEIVGKIESFLSPELVNRIDEIILFKPFSDEEFMQLAANYLDDSAKKIRTISGGTIEFDNENAAAAFICSRMTARDRLMGARAVKRIVGKFFEGAFLEEFYKNPESERNFICFANEDRLFFEEKSD